jgi:hypothetical protein
LVHYDIVCIRNERNGTERNGTERNWFTVSFYKEFCKIDIIK